MSHANGTERAWRGYGKRLQALLVARMPSRRIVVNAREATDWHEPGSERNGMDYWVLTARIYGSGVPLNEHMAERVTASIVGAENIWSDDFDPEDDDPYWVADVLCGLECREAARILRDAQRESAQKKEKAAAS